jgi:hypothetical protein
VRGETVTVITRTQTGTDPGGDAIWTTTETPVDNVLVANGSQTLSTDSIRPDGIEVACTLYFPRSFSGSLRGGIVKVRGHEYRVLGDPLPYDGGMTPTQWNLVVECERGDG